MFKKSKLMLASVLALVMCFASVTPAMAAPLNGGGAAVGDETNPVQVAITKNLEVPVGTNIPDATFTFTADKVSLDDQTDAAAKASMPALHNLTLTFAPGDSGDTVAGITTVIKETGDLFENVDFPHAGIYVYTITENGIGSNTAIESDTTHQTLTYSHATYTMTVYVENSTSGTGTYVYAVGTKVVVPDNDDQAVGDKVDPSLGGDDVNYHHSQMMFTNTYVKTNGTDDPDNPDPTDPDQSTLSVSKAVTGSLASKELYFNFSMTLSIPTLVDPIPATYKAYVVENGAIVTSTENGAAAGNNYIAVATSGATTFSLKHGQQLVFVNTPVGTSYTVTETISTGYDPSYAITTAGVQATTVTGNATSVQYVGEELDGTDGLASNKADFTNERNVMAPTGLNLNDLPFIAMILVAVGALVIFIVVKSRTRQEKKQQ